MKSKTLTIETKNSGTKNYTLVPEGSGFDVYRNPSGFFGSKQLIGHGGSMPDSVLVARIDAGDHGNNIRSTKLRDS